MVAFQKISLNAGESTTVRFTIDPAASHHPLSYWDTNTNDWNVAGGFYPIYVGQNDVPHSHAR